MISKKDVMKLFVAIIIIAIIIMIFIRYFRTDNQEEDIYGGDEIEESYTELDQLDKQPVKEEETWYYKAPPSSWPKITFAGTISAVVVFVALIFGFASFFIGYNAGGKISKGKIWASIIIAFFVGVLARSINILLKVKLFQLLNYFFPKHELLCGTIADTIIYLLWIIFIAGIAVYMYETFTVTAEEAHPTL